MVQMRGGPTIRDCVTVLIGDTSNPKAKVLCAIHLPFMAAVKEPSLYMIIQGHQHVRKRVGTSRKG